MVIYYYLVKYLAIYHLFETQVCHITWLLEIQVLGKNSLQICHNIFYGTQVCKTQITL